MSEYKTLKKNSVKCLSCNEELVSTYRHHFIMCGCSNNTYTDGGLSYQRCGGDDMSLVEVTSEYNEVE